MKHVKQAIGGALVTAAVSTFGDFLWANAIPHHQPVYGLTHGTVLFLTVGLYLGALTGKAVPGAIGGALIGFLAAGGFYVLRPALGYSAMFLLYVGVWIALGMLNGRVLQAAREPIGRVVVRSLVAAVGTGAGFYAVSGIWFPFNPHGWDYAVHFAAWTVAYLPAFLVLLFKRQA